MEKAADTQYVVDRITPDGSAHLENAEGRLLAVPAEWLPEQALEGAVLDVRSSAVTAGLGVVVLTFNEAATSERRSAAETLRSQLPRGPEGDLDL